MNSNEMARRIRGVLRDMTMLSEARGTSYDGDRVKGGGSKSAPPPGVRFGQRDLRDLSLAEYWGDRFRKAKDRRTVEFFLYLAERDLSNALRRPETRDPHEGLETRANRICEAYEGLSALEAAVAEDSTEIYIKSIRIKNDRDSETGWPISYVNPESPFGI